MYYAFMRMSEVDPGLNIGRFKESRLVIKVNRYTTFF